MTFHVPERFRITRGPMASTKENGNNGAFFIRHKTDPVPLKVIASDGFDFEHVSVSLPTRCPTWDEMCYIVSLFWDPDDTVMQLHPPRSEWINNHPFCLHLWAVPPGSKTSIPMPPSWMVGYKELNP